MQRHLKLPCNRVVSCAVDTSGSPLSCTSNECDAHASNLDSSGVAANNLGRTSGRPGRWLSLSATFMPTRLGGLRTIPAGYPPMRETSAATARQELPWSNAAPGVLPGLSDLHRAIDELVAIALCPTSAENSRARPRRTLCSDG
jgi:hypothetical protein